MGRTNRRAALSVPAAHRLFGQSGYVGEYRRVAQSIELFARAHREQGSRLAQRIRLRCWAWTHRRIAKAALDRAVQFFFGGQAAPTTVETLEKQLDNPQILQAKLDDPVKQVDLGVVAGLVLGAPEFQRR